MSRQLAGVFIGLALAQGAYGASLVVMAVDSGSDITAPYASQPPLLTPGAKGFLIGVDIGDPSIEFDTFVENLTLFGAGLVNIDGVDLSNGNLLQPPKIMTSTEAVLQGADDGIAYRREDSYFIDHAQTTPQGPRNWLPVASGWEAGGSAQGFLRGTAKFGVGAPSQGGVRPIAYVVATESLYVSGTINPSNPPITGIQFFDVFGNEIPVPGAAGTAILDFATGTLQPATIPTGPGTLVTIEAQTSMLFNIDRSTGMAQFGRPTGLPALAGISFASDGMLYGITAPTLGHPCDLFTIDPGTGASALVGPTAIMNTNINRSDLAFNPVSGELFILDSERHLYRIDRTTGGTSLVGQLPLLLADEAYSGLAFAADGRLFVHAGPMSDSGGNSNLLTVDPATAAILGAQTLSLTLKGTYLEWDAENGMLSALASAQSPNEYLWRIDPATGNVTSIGRAGATSYYLRGLALRPVPEPTAIALAGCGLVSLLWLAASRCRAMAPKRGCIGRRSASVGP